MVALAALFAVPLWLWRGKDVGAGAVLEVPITLVTADKHELSCALDRPINGHRCAFSAPDVAWPDPPEPVHTLVQYFTTERRLFVIPGLFEQPAIAERYRSEPPQGRRPSRLKRFTAVCQLRLLEKVRGIHTRWAPNGDWGLSDGWVAEPVSCQLRGG